MNMHRYSVLVLSGLLLPLSLAANPVVRNWVAYSPAEPWQPGQVIDDSLVSVDLQTLAWRGFDGLVTYGTLDSLCTVPRIARSLGFGYVIMGVWIDTNTVTNRQGIELAIQYHEDADAICVGNEALFFNRVSPSYLAWAMDTVRSATGKPVTTSEHWTMYLDPAHGPWLQRHSDFLFPIMNPTDNGIHDPDQAFEWVARCYDTIAVHSGDSLRVLVKEAGWPTWSDSAPQRAWANEDNQDAFFGQLEALNRDSMRYFCFEAFDQWWKNWGPTQRYWGLFDSGRRPKLYAHRLALGESRPSPRQHATPTYGLPTSYPAVLYNIIGQKVRAGTVRRGVYFAGLQPLGFRKVLLVR